MFFLQIKNTLIGNNFLTNIEKITKKNTSWWNLLVVEMILHGRSRSWDISELETGFPSQKESGKPTTSWKGWNTPFMNSTRSQKVNKGVNNKVHHEVRGSRTIWRGFQGKDAEYKDRCLKIRNRNNYISVTVLKWSNKY